MLVCNQWDSVTAYPIKDDALETGELDYVNGGIQCLISLKSFLSAKVVHWREAQCMISFIMKEKVRN